MKADASLGRRLLLGASVFIVVALVVATIVIGFVLHRFVQGQIDQRLDTQVAFLASTVKVAPAGEIALDGSADGPPSAAGAASGKPNVAASPFTSWAA